eukprot:10746239-Alexandrium_andersonii.AAC.1
MTSPSVLTRARVTRGMPPCGGSSLRGSGSGVSLSVSRGVMVFVRGVGVPRRLSGASSGRA